MNGQHFFVLFGAIFLCKKVFNNNLLISAKSGGAEE